MSLSALKRKARSKLHKQFGEPCVYTAPDGTVTPSAEQLAEGLALHARSANRLRQFTPESEAVTILEGVERVIFNQDELDALGLVPEHAGRLVLPDLELTFDLDQQMDPDGPLNRYWTVTRA